jgi:hypothetical protein
MSDFVTRLERELIEAIEREQRAGRLVGALRARAPRLARRALAAAAVAAIVAALALTLPRGQRDEEPRPAGPVPEHLVGDYSRRGGQVALILDIDRYTLLLPRGQRVVGPAGVDRGVLLLGDDGTGACDGTADPARYHARRSGPDLRLEVIEDSCAARADQLTAGPLLGDG